jgi:ubiquinone biosynthesis protein
VKYGFEGLTDALRIEQYVEAGLDIISRKPRVKVERLSRAERVRMAVEELGPTFVKLGQILSTRPDLVPVDFVHEFEKLQDDVAPFEYQDVKMIVEKELAQPLEGVFQNFEEAPLAAASIGQVHRAQLKDGEDVVVKVQRPGIRKIIEVDLEIMLHLASLMERHLEDGEIHRPTRIVAEFARSIEKEIDYTVEASYMEHFARQFQGDMSIHVPMVFRKASTHRVLTTEYVDGIKASRIDSLNEAGLDRKLITARGADLILKQVFEHGFFHADPHPGNIFVLPDNVVCYLDYGMMGSIDRQTREDCAELLYALAGGDEAKAVDALLKLAEYDEQPSRSMLKRDMADFMAKHLHKALKEIEMGKLLQGILDLLSRHRLRIPHDLILMLKALTTWEGVGRSLDPDFHVMERAAPFIEHIRMARMHPGRVADDLWKLGLDLVRFAREIPTELREILLQLKQGKIKMDFAHRGLEPLLKNQYRVSKRISASIIIGALIVGSSLIVVSRTPPFIFGVPIVALIGFAIAAVMAAWLLIRS